MARRGGIAEQTTSTKNARPTASGWRDWRHAVAGGLLLAYAWLALSAVRDKCTTFDEVAHLTAGYSYWRYGDYRLHPENGNLPQRWVAWPLLGRYSFPPLDMPAWRDSYVYPVAKRFFYQQGNDADAMLRAGRRMNVLLGMAVGVVIYLWGSQLLGRNAGLLSLGLFCFSPAMLAHGALATSDMAATLGFTASAWALASLINRVTLPRITACTIALSWLALSKFSAPVMLPIAGGLLLVRLFAHRPWPMALGSTITLTTWQQRLAMLLGLAAVQLALVWSGIWLAYSGRYEMFRNGDPQVDHLQMAWDEVLPEKSSLNRLILAARDHRLLPEAYLYGFSYTLGFSESRRAFLNGEYGQYGWTGFFPYCLLAKTPLSLLFVVVLALAAAWWRVTQTTNSAERAAAWRKGLCAASPLLVLLAVYWYVALTSHLNVGERHLLPTYPAMYILAGAAIWWWCPSWAAACGPAPSKRPALTKGHSGPSRSPSMAALRWLPLVAIASLAAESLLVWPHYLAYFNVAAGGSKNGYRHLVDSSLDWGQDLPGLRDWLASPAANLGQQPVYLSYFGTGDPTYYGIRAELLPCYFELPPTEEMQPLRGGTYCISATMLQGVYLRNPGPWDGTKEADYGKLLALLQAWNAAADQPAQQQEMLRQLGEQGLAKLVRRFEEMRFNRLCHFLLQREPDQEIGYSILIYRLGDEEVQRYVFGPL